MGQLLQVITVITLPIQWHDWKFAHCNFEVHLECFWRTDKLKLYKVQLGTLVCIISVILRSPHQNRGPGPTEQRITIASGALLCIRNPPSLSLRNCDGSSIWLAHQRFGRKDNTHRSRLQADDSNKVHNHGWADSQTQQQRRIQGPLHLTGRNRRRRRRVHRSWLHPWRTTVLENGGNHRGELLQDIFTKWVMLRCAQF